MFDPFSVLASLFHTGSNAFSGLAGANDTGNAFAQLPNSPWPQQPSRGLPPVGPLLGTEHTDSQLAPRVAGDVRPMAPGEYVVNGDHSWSSEISETVPHPSSPGKWTNIPSVWVVGGVPQRLSQQDSIAAARSSGLKWPEFNSAQEADRAAAARETMWQGVKDPSKVAPLWTGYN